MAASTPSGHPSNMANFELLIASCIGYGTPYNPSNNNLKVLQLQTLQTSGKSAMQNVKTTKTTYDNACNAREIGGVPMKKYCTRIMNALESSTASQQTIDDARTINNKIQGKRANGSKKAPVLLAAGESGAVVTEVKSISKTQQSFDSLLDNFQKLVVLLTAEPLYLPNETDLKLAALNTTLNNLRALNTAAINATIQYKNAMIARDTTLYQPTGLVPVALEVKKYVKSVFGATSPQYKQISGLAFRIIRKK